TLSSQDNRLAFDIAGPDFSRTHVLSLTPMKTVIRDYGLMCESYYEALRGSSPSQIETVDMGRRGLHNAGAALLKARLEGKVEVDQETARRLFTLVCALYRRGRTRLSKRFGALGALTFTARAHGRRGPAVVFTRSREAAWLRKNCWSSPSCSANCCRTRRFA